MSSATTTFAYNADGLRDSLTFDSNTTTFTWDVAMSIPQVLDDEGLRYVYGLGRIAQVDDGDVGHYYLSDGLGSTMALTDDAGDVVNSYDYDVFGAVRSSTGSQDNVFEFAGEQVDGNTGLQYLRARYYDQAIGRFISRDTFPGLVEMPLSQNAFGYGHASPTNLTDPSGAVATTNPVSAPKEGRINSSKVGDLLGGLRGRFCKAIAFCDTWLGGGGPRTWTINGVKVPPPLNISASRMQHIVDRHAPGSKAPNTSKFIDGLNYENMASLAQNVKPVLSKNGYYTREVNYGSPVGNVRGTGAPTNWYTVVQDADGNVITIHPGHP